MAKRQDSNGPRRRLAMGAGVTAIAAIAVSVAVATAGLGASSEPAPGVERLSGPPPDPVIRDIDALDPVHRPAVMESVSGVAFGEGVGEVQRETHVWRWKDTHGVTTIAEGGATGGKTIGQCARSEVFRACILTGGPQGYVVGTADAEVQRITVHFGDRAVDAALRDRIWVVGTAQAGAARGDIVVNAHDAEGREVGMDAARETSERIEMLAALPLPE